MSPIKKTTIISEPESDVQTTKINLINLEKQQHKFNFQILVAMAGFAFFVCTVVGCGTKTAPTTVVPTIQAASQVSDTAVPATPLTESDAPSATTGAIVHSAKPGIPPVFTYNISDSDSSVSAVQHRPQGDDYFNKGLLERPFNADTQDQYFPAVDILQTSMANGTPWIYGAILLKGPNAVSGKLDASYALELDTNMDGRGEYLIVANPPLRADDWSTEGVQIWQDANNDVGGNTPILAEAMAQGKGFDQKLFDSGQGADPDLAWVRVASEQSNVVWFAVKTSLISSASKWMWGAWAQQGGLHPELYDYNDHMTLAEAGNPMPSDPNYPLKALAEVDGTCRWVVGSIPTGNEPGLCPIQTTASPTPMPTPTPTSHRILVSTQGNKIEKLPPTPTPLSMVTGIKLPKGPTQKSNIVKQ
jgi:hypothetical protein